MRSFDDFMEVDAYITGDPNQDLKSYFINPNGICYIRNYGGNNTEIGLHAGDDLVFLATSESVESLFGKIKEYQDYSSEIFNSAIEKLNFKDGQ